MRLHLVVCLSFFTCSLIAQKKVDREEYKPWFQENLLRFERKYESSELVYRVLYLPNEVSLLSEYTGKESKVELKSMYKEQDKYLDFILRIEDVQRTIEQKYQNYLSMSFQNDIELVVDQKDTLKCVGFSFDQVAEISPNRTFKIGFERPKKYKELELILSQPEKEEIKFRYVYADLANTPKIRWK